MSEPTTSAQPVQMPAADVPLGYHPPLRVPTRGTAAPTALINEQTGFTGEDGG